METNTLISLLIEQISEKIFKKNLQLNKTNVWQSLSCSQIFN